MTAFSALCHVSYHPASRWQAKLQAERAQGCRPQCHHQARGDFLLVVRSPGKAPQLHHRFLDRRIPLPLHPGWSDWLWERGLRTGEIEELKGEGIRAYRCRPDVEALRADLAASVSVGELVVTSDSKSDAGLAAVVGRAVDED